MCAWCSARYAIRCLVSATRQEQEPYIYGSLSGSVIALVPEAVPPPQLFTEDHTNNIRAFAAEHRLPIPRFKIEIPASDVPDPFRRFVGVWIDDRGPLKESRNVMLIVTRVAKNGKASVHWVWSPPGPKSLHQGPPGSFSVVGQIVGATLSYSNPSGGESFKHALTSDGSIRYNYSDSKGQTDSLVLIPVWTLEEAERLAKR